MRLREVIKHEGDKWVLYASDGKKKLGTFDTEEKAKKRERQIQFFKHREAERKPIATLVEKLTHTAAWHKCWEKVKKNYDDRAAAAICTWSISRPPNPPSIYKGAPARASASAERVMEAVVTLTLDDAYALDEVLAAEMELRGLKGLLINTEDWSMTEVTEAGKTQNPNESVAEYSPEFEAARVTLAKVGLLDAGARHTRREYQIIEEAIRLMAELHGELEGLNQLLTVTQESAGANVANYLESRIHQSFTADADSMLGEGVIERDERIALSHAIGIALNAFSIEVDRALPALRSRPLDLKYAQFTNDVLLASMRESSSGFESRFIHEQVTCQEAQITIDEQGNLKGRVIIEGVSSNGNDYTVRALETVGKVFAGRPVYVDHPTRTEETDRPERSVRDLVGKLPEDPLDFYVDTVKEGKFAGRKATFFRNGKLSKTADWLATLVREKIAGDMSINAIGKGHGGPNQTFAVEAFVDATSLDFVTKAGAGGQGVLESAGRPAADIHRVLLETLTVAEVAEVAPHILDEIAKRERQKAYGEKQELITAKEALGMAQSTLTGTQKALAEAIGKLRTYRIQEETGKAQSVVEGELTAAKLPESAAKHVRHLMEADVRKLAEATAAEMPLVSVGKGLKPGDPPNLEVPPDVAELPPEAQGIWLEGFVANLAKGDEQATHMAWAAVYNDGWAKDDAGAWKKAQVNLVSGEQMPVPMTAADLKKKTGDVIKEVRALFAQQTGAGQPVGVGVSAAQAAGARAGEGGEEQDKAALLEAFKGVLPADQAQIAAEWR